MDTCTSNHRKRIVAFAVANKDVRELQFIVADPEGVAVQEISGNGMMNHVFRVRAKVGDRSVILKFGRQEDKAAMDDAMTLHRQIVEYKSLLMMDEIQPGIAPKPYCFDRQHGIIVMEDMSGWELLGDQLEAGDVDQDAAMDLGQSLGKLHQATAKSSISSERWEKLQSDFRNARMLDLNNQFLYGWPYDENNKTNTIPTGQLETYRNYVKTITELKLNEKCSSLLKTEDCYVHADLHWKSVFVKNGKAAIFDSEFSLLSHPSLDVGFAVRSYIVYHLITQNQETYAALKSTLPSQFQQAITNFLCHYLNECQGLSEANEATFISQIALVTGGLLFSAAMFDGTANIAKVTEVERTALMHVAFKLLTCHKSLNSIKKLTAAIFNDQ